MRALCILLLLLGIEARAQAVDSTWTPHGSEVDYHDELTLLAGYHQGTYGFAELGIGRNIYSMWHLPVGFGYYAGAELRVDRSELVGVKVGCYLNAVVALGVQLIQYTEQGNGSTVLRPELGFGALKGKVTYAYNIGLSPDRLPGINTHMISFTYAFRMLRLPGDESRSMPH